MGLNMRFNCTGCGECCRRLGGILGNSDGIIGAIASEFPYKPEKDGSCPMLKDNRCSVYKNRPLLCDFKKIFEQHPRIARTELLWYMRNMLICNHFMDQANIPQEFRLKEPCAWD